MTSTDSAQDKDLLERYRRASDSEAAAPSEAVRAAILAEGRRVAAERAARVPERTIDPSRPAANDSRWKITAFGTAGAAILAALLFAPRYWESQVTPRPDRAPAAARTAMPASTPMAASKPAPAKTEGAPAESADAAAPPPLAKVAPTSAKVAPHAPAENSSPAEESSALEPRENLRIARQRPRTESIAPSAVQNYAPAAPPALAAAPPAANAPPAPAATPPAPTVAQLAAPSTPISSVITSGARAMSADRAAGARLHPPDTTLLQAAASGDLARATGLLDNGAPVDERDELGRTALMLAATQGRLDVVRLLLERGADPNAADNAGRTPLQQAMQKNLPDVVALLQRAGAR